MKPKEITPAKGLYDQMQEFDNVKYYKDFSFETLIDFAEELSNQPAQEVRATSLLSGIAIKELYPGEYDDIEDNKIYILNYE